MRLATNFPEARGGNLRASLYGSLLVAFACLCPAEEPETKADPVPPGDPAALAKELSAAVAAGDTERAVELVDTLAASGSPEAFTAIIEHALSGADYELEKHAGALLGETKDPRVRRLIFDGISKSSNYKTRIILIAVAARLVEDPAALPAIHAALKDPVRHVVYAAIYWVKKLGSTESVDPLIDALEAREAQKVQDRTYFDTRRALEALVGGDVETSQEWRSLWAARKKGLAAPGRAKESRTVVYKKAKPKFFSMDLDSSRILFIIDVSGSMAVRDPTLVEEEPDPSEKKRTVVVPSKEKRGGTSVAEEEIPIIRERLTRVRAELTRAISMLPQSVRFGVLAFSHEMEFFGGVKAIREATPENRTLAVQWVKGLRARGATRTDTALEEALSMRDVDTIFVLTDGAPKTAEGEGGTRIPIDPILESVKEKNRFLRARIHTISFAQIRDTSMKRFVKQLADQNDGKSLLLE